MAMPAKADRLKFIKRSRSIDAKGAQRFVNGIL
jgi:hypothetical protein